MSFLQNNLINLVNGSNLWYYYNDNNDDIINIEFYFKGANNRLKVNDLILILYKNNETLIYDKVDLCYLKSLNGDVSFLLDGEVIDNLLARIQVVENAIIVLNNDVDIIKAQITDIQQNITIIENNLLNETQERTNADNLLQNNINTEIVARTEADTEEQQARIERDIQLQTNLTNEIARATTQETTIDNDLQTFKTDTTNNINVLKDNVAENKNDIDNLQNNKANITDLNNEIARATTQETTINTNLTNEITRATTTEQTINDTIRNLDLNLTNLIGNETDRAIDKENLLQTNIDNEVARATNIEQTKIDINNIRINDGGDWDNKRSVITGMKQDIDENNNMILKVYGSNVEQQEDLLSTTTIFTKEQLQLLTTPTENGEYKLVVNDGVLTWETI
jgi:chromosome segregation ATPase